MTDDNAPTPDGTDPFVDDLTDRLHAAVDGVGAPGLTEAGVMARVGHRAAMRRRWSAVAVVAAAVVVFVAGAAVAASQGREPHTRVHTTNGDTTTSVATTIPPPIAPATTTSSVPQTTASTTSTTRPASTSTTTVAPTTTTTVDPRLLAPICTTSQIGVDMRVGRVPFSPDGKTDFYIFRFINWGNEPCRLEGFPTVSLWSNQTLLAQASPVASGPGKTSTYQSGPIAPRHVAEMDLEFSRSCPNAHLDQHWKRSIGIQWDGSGAKFVRLAEGTIISTDCGLFSTNFYATTSFATGPAN